MSDAGIVTDSPAVDPAPTEAPAATPPADGQQQPDSTPPAERTFKQSELDAIVSKRLGKAERAWERRHREMLEMALDRVVKPAAEPQQVDDAPDPEKFSDLKSYMAAVARYEAKQMLSQTAQEHGKAREQQTVKERQATLARNFQAQVDKGAEKYDDFAEVALDPSVPISEVMAEAIAESDVGVELAYHLGKNRTEAARIAALGPVAAARELGKLEAKLTAAPPIRSTSAPAPITPVKGAAKTEKDPSDMSSKEFAEWRRKQISARS